MVSINSYLNVLFYSFSDMYLSSFSCMTPFKAFLSGALAFVSPTGTFIHTYIHLGRVPAGEGERKRKGKNPKQALHCQYWIP